MIESVTAAALVLVIVLLVLWKEQEVNIMARTKSFKNGSGLQNKTILR